MDTKTTASNASAPVRATADRGHMFAAMRYPNYRLWFAGQLASLVGTWMQSTAQQFLVYQLTQSPAYLGYVGFASGVASWLFTLYAGAVADRVSRRNLMVVTQTAMMVLAFALAVLTFAGVVQPWHIVVLAFLLGIANAFDAPARQAFVVEMVDREDLTNAIALNSSLFNAAAFVGPAVAGVTYALAGPAWCFVVNGVSFIAVIVALLLMKLKPVMPRERAGSLMKDLGEGLSYVWHHGTVRTMIITVGLASLFGLSFVTLFPAWAVTVLGGDATTNGLLQSARGLGALGGALMIAALGRFKSKGRLLTIGTFVFPVLVLLFAQIRWLPLSLLVLAGAGWGFMIVLNMANTLVQTQVPDELRGRVMGIYTLTFFGFMPIGALLAGQAATVIDEPLTVTVSALVLLAYAGLLWTLAPRLRKLQ
jgi:MFS family permease